MLTYQNNPKLYSPSKSKRKSYSISCIIIFFMLFIFTFTMYFLYTTIDWNNSNTVGNKLINSNPFIKNELLETMPDYSLEHWSLIELSGIFVADGKANGHLKFCKLNFQKYSESPHLYPMFRDLVAMSKCSSSGNTKSILLQDELEKDPTTRGRVIPPTGFVFHESRVGSTLVANTLASNPWNMVFSESDPPANALTHCDGCSEDQAVQLFKDVINLMGITPVHTHLFFKFQSITSTKIHIALKAFPSTPWVFIFRQSVQTMMSHLDPEKGGGGPCLRSKSSRSPPTEVSNAIEVYEPARSASREAWCAAHLNMLCTHALEAFKNFGNDENSKFRGLLIHYEGLPASVPVIILRLFGVKANDFWLKRMQEVSNFYSKARKHEKVFTGDSTDKDQRASDELKKWAKKILDPTYHLMSRVAVEGALKLAPQEISDLPDVSLDEAEGPETLKDWSELKFPDYSKATGKKKYLSGNMIEHISGYTKSLSDREGNAHDRHSHYHQPGREDTEEEFYPWLPFASAHSSKAFEKIKCPSEPPDDYPKSYPVMDLITNWNPDNTNIPGFHYDSLCHFDLSIESEREKAVKYREAEKPFVGFNYPEVDEVTEKWADLSYLKKKIGSQTFRTETSRDNHFMYWTNGRKVSKDKNWKPPTGSISISFDEWLEEAVTNQNISLGERVHKYFRVTADDERRSTKNSWLFKELKFFQPKKSLFMVKPEFQQGIHCRFGMRSIIAEAHFDRSRNSVAMLRGMRRWIMTHPSQCENMYILPKSHPSGRHSDVDWSNPDLEAFPDFPKVKAHEIILQPGDILYVPTNWIHYIVSLNVNIQCNSRSGSTHNYDKDTGLCGF